MEHYRIDNGMSGGVESYTILIAIVMITVSDQLIANHHSLYRNCPFTA